MLWPKTCEDPSLLAPSFATTPRDPLSSAGWMPGVTSRLASLPPSLLPFSLFPQRSQWLCENGNQSCRLSSQCPAVASCLTQDKNRSPSDSPQGRWCGRLPSLTPPFSSRSYWVCTSHTGLLDVPSTSRSYCFLRAFAFGCCFFQNVLLPTFLPSLLSYFPFRSLLTCSVAFSDKSIKY